MGYDQTEKSCQSCRHARFERSDPPGYVFIDCRAPIPACVKGFERIKFMEFDDGQDCQSWEPAEA